MENQAAHAHKKFERILARTPTKYLREIPYLILTEKLVSLCGSNYLQTHGTAMGTKMAVAFANIFMTRIENQILRQSCIKSYPGHQRIFSRVRWDASVSVAGRQIFGRRQKSLETKPRAKKLFAWVTIKTLPNQRPMEHKSRQNRELKSWKTQTTFTLLSNSRLRCQKQRSLS